MLAWLERLPIRVLESDAALLVVRAWVLSLSARRDEALRTVALIERFDSVEQGSLSEGATSIEAIVAVLRATFHWGDIGAAYENAVLASELPQPAGLYRAAALYSRGYCEFFRGEFEEADRWLAEAAAYALSAERWILAASALAFRSLAAGERGDLELQSRLADQAEDVARERALEEILGEAPTALGASLAGRGRLGEARPHLEQGVAVLRTYGQPIDLAHALIREARVLLALEERDTAAAVVVEARATVDSCRDPGVVEEWLTALERPRRARPGRSGNELSQRELAVLRALTGSLSEGDIARELYLSRNTVHSHTRSIYRKLGVSSRVQAVRQARELGLL